MRQERWTTRLALGMLAVAVAAGFSGDVAAADLRLTVTVDEPFVVDGNLYPAGTLSLRPVRAFTPTTMLNEVWVGNRCLGLLSASRTDDPIREASRNAVLFVRDADGRLVLRGFAYRADGAGDRYRYAMLAPRKVNAPTSLNDDASPILIAANRTR